MGRNISPFIADSADVKVIFVIVACQVFAVDVAGRYYQFCGSYADGAESIFKQTSAAALIMCGGSVCRAGLGNCINKHKMLVMDMTCCGSKLISAFCAGL